MINIAVLDDDLDIVSVYEKKISQILSNNKIDGELILATNSPDKLIKTIENKLANVCILDIDLKTDINGMDIASRIREKDQTCEILFMTAHPQYMHQAFDVKAYNYIAKPGWKSLEKNLIRLSNELEKRQEKKNICIKSGSNLLFIVVSEILCIEHVSSKTVIHTTSGNYQINEGLEEFASSIKGINLMRLHRSYYINTNYIKKIDIKNREIMLENNMKFKIGRAYFSDFKEWSSSL